MHTVASAAQIAPHSAASLQSSPDPPSSRPGLRRTRKTQTAAIASMRLQNEQMSSGVRGLAGAAVSRIVLAETAPPVALLNDNVLQRRLNSGTPTHHIPRASSEPPQEWNVGARPLQALHMSGELNRPVTSDLHAGVDVRLRVPGEAPPNATPSLLESGVPSTSSTPVAKPPVFWRDRSNIAFLAIESTRFRSGGAALPDDDDAAANDSDEGSPTLTIPETISSNVDMQARRRAQRLSELGSEYSWASGATIKAGKSRRAPSEGSFGRELFRP
ncbi:MAG: hypothetical protein INR71_12385 [Terriglobus roseus]|nr:hypothetical protein [Terriglobus roseus]